MKAPAFAYIRPTDVKGALAALAGAGGEGRPLAGGQTLGPMLNLRLVRPALLVDIRHIDALKRIEKRGNVLALGSGVTHAMLEDRHDLSATGRLLSHVASTIAYRAIRNFGTVGGSLCHADPAADWITVMALVDAKLSIVGTEGARKVRMSQFMKGAFTTVIGPAELLAEIEIEAFSADARWGYYRLCRKAGEFPDALGAAVFDPGHAIARVFAGALYGAPVPLRGLAERVANEGATAASLEVVMAALREAVPGLDAVDLQLHAVCVRRAILQAVAS